MSCGTGAYGYPIESAAEVAVKTVREVLSASSPAVEVTFCCFSTDDLAIYEALLGARNSR